jgi:hypothetical protein
MAEERMIAACPADRDCEACLRTSMPASFFGSGSE